MVEKVKSKLYDVALRLEEHKATLPAGLIQQIIEKIEVLKAVVEQAVPDEVPLRAPPMI